MARFKKAGTATKPTKSTNPLEPSTAGKIINKISLIPSNCVPDALRQQKPPRDQLAALANLEVNWKDHAAIGCLFEEDKALQSCAVGWEFEEAHNELLLNCVKLAHKEAERKYDHQMKVSNTVS